LPHSNRYTYVDHTTGVWNGSLLIVLGEDVSPSSMQLAYDAAQMRSSPRNIFDEEGHSFWRYSLSVHLQSEEQQVKYTIDYPRVHGSFSVPGNDQNMRIMFHSCNGFSVKIPADKFAGPALWNDVSQQGNHVFFY
jgi:hypothetical protein